MFQCFKCGGHGWILNGDIEDGCMTGRETCPKCKGTRLLSAEEVLAEVRYILQASVPYPPIQPGTRVKTTKPNMALRKQWSDRGWAEKKWGVTGKVITHHDSHGLCYHVRHDDGSEGYYDPSELEVVTP